MSNSKFRSLTPTQFENLTYDLLSWRGLRNATWRTPGADGGRDIEGTYEVQDLSGAYQSQKWYVDCKLYSKSVDWPTVYEKLAYAESNRADFLLIVCTPSVSPACRTEIDKWNAKTNTARIRTWEPHYLEQLLVEHPEIAIKYGFRKASILDAPGFIEIAIETSKCADAAYLRSSFETTTNNPELELSSALANFMANQMQQKRAASSQAIERPFYASKDGYDWLKITPSADEKTTHIDALTVRAISCFLRLVSGGHKSISLDLESRGLRLTPESGTIPKLNKNEDKLLQALCLFGAVEYNLTSSNLILRAQIQ